MSCDGHAGFLAAIHRIFPSRSDRDRRAAADRRGIFRKAPASSPLSCERSHFLPRVLGEGPWRKRKKEAVGNVNGELAPRANLFLGPQVFEETMNQTMDIALGQREGVVVDGFLPDGAVD